MSARAVLASLAFVLAACTSPESTRQLGGGPGADTGNRGDVVRMHEGSRPYHDTPRVDVGQSPPIDTANHARDLATR